MNTHETRRLLSTLALCLATALAGCDGNSSSSGSGGTTAANAPASPENPKSIYGKSAKMGKDLRDDINAEQTNTAAAAGVISGEGNMVEIGGLLWPIPAEFKRANPSEPMRAAEFKVDGPGGPATVVFFTGIKGDVQANIDRWKGQMTPGEGARPGAPQKTRNFQGIKVTTIKIEGTYKGMDGKPLPETRFLGAIAEGPRGQVQIRMTGQYDTMDEVEKYFDAMVAGVQSK